MHRYIIFSPSKSMKKEIIDKAGKKLEYTKVGGSA